MKQIIQGAEKRIGEHIAGSLHEVVGQHRCEKCDRPGQLVQQFGNPAHPSMGIPAPWVFRYYLCRHHRAAENRKIKGHKKRYGYRKKRTVVIKYLPDSEVLANGEL